VAGLLRTLHVPDPAASPKAGASGWVLRGWRKVLRGGEFPYHVAAVLVTALAVFLRVYRLDGRSLWIDEVISSEAAKVRSFGDVFAYTRSYGNEAPLPDVITWLFRGLGPGEAVLRLPSVIEGSLLVLAIYALGRKLFGARLGLFAALLATLLPFSVWYSQEARPYALLMLLTTTQMLVAYFAATRGRLLAWAALAVVSALNLYTHYAAIPVTVAAFAFVGITLFLRRFGLVRGSEPAGRPERVQFFLLAAAAALTIALYRPWFGPLRSFLSNTSLGFGRFPAHHVATLSEVSALLAAFGFSGLVLILLFAGLLAALVMSGGGRILPGMLLLSWLGVPLAALTLKLGGGLVLLLPRYFSALLPVAIILAALGVDGAVRIILRAPTLSRPRGRAVAKSLLSVGGMGIIAVLTVPALAKSYAIPKDDYRSAAAHIMATSPNDSVVLGLGPYSHITVKGLNYYFDLKKAGVRVFDAHELNDQAVSRLYETHGAVWGAIYPRNDMDLADMIATSYTGVTIFRLRNPTGSPTAQAIKLLQWAKSFDPALYNGLTLLVFQSGLGGFGGNLLPGPSGDEWQLAGGSSRDLQQQAFDLKPNGPMVNVTLKTRAVHAGETYLLTFKYRNSNLRGEQRVFASAHDTSGAWLEIFPDGAGYQCLSTPDWSTGAFVFTLPRDGDSMIIWLRATGYGAAEFREVELRPHQ